MRDDRQQALTMMHERLDHEHIDAVREYTRDEATDQLGKSWSNIATLVITDDVSVSEYTDMLERLDDAGFITSCGCSEEYDVFVEVSITYDVMERVRGNV